MICTIGLSHPDKASAKPTGEKSNMASFTRCLAFDYKQKIVAFLCPLHIASATMDTHSHLSGDFDFNLSHINHLIFQTQSCHVIKHYDWHPGRYAYPLCNINLAPVA